MNNLQDFYVYAWYNIDTNEIFYIGKGRGKRYQSKSNRNQKFIEYINNHNVEVIIMAQDLNEEQAFALEKILTDQYKELGQCQCNLAQAGKGGCHFVWTEEMKKYWSIYNPMKAIEQRERMRNNNPMHNKEIALKNGAAHKNPIFIGEVVYDGIVDAAFAFSVSKTTIEKWLMRQATPDGVPCGYMIGLKNTKKGRPVLVDNVEYPSLAAAARAIQVSPNNLRNAINNNKPCKNHQCKYVDQQPSQ